eukprot:tig00020830_g14473.t1
MEQADLSVIIARGKAAGLLERLHPSLNAATKETLRELLRARQRLLPLLDAGAKEALRELLQESEAVDAAFDKLLSLMYVRPLQLETNNAPIVRTGAPSATAAAASDEPRGSSSSSGSAAPAAGAPPAPNETVASGSRAPASVPPAAIPAEASAVPASAPVVTFPTAAGPRQDPPSGVGSTTTQAKQEPAPAQPQPFGTISGELAAQPKFALNATPRRGMRKRRPVRSFDDDESSSSSRSSPSSAAASPAASPHAKPAARGRKREAASPVASLQAEPAASCKSQQQRAEGEAASPEGTEGDEEDADEEVEVVVGAEAEAEPEGFYRKTIAAVLGGGTQDSWVHTTDKSKKKRRLGPVVEIGERYCVARRSWNPELPTEPGQPGCAYRIEAVRDRVFTAELMRQSDEFGGVLLAVPVADTGTSRCQIMGYYRVAEPVAMPFTEMREREPAVFEVPCPPLFPPNPALAPSPSPAWLTAVLRRDKPAGWFWGRQRETKLTPEMPGYDDLLRRREEERAKYQRRHEKKAEITKRGGRGRAQREVDEELRAWAAAELEAEVLLKIPFTPVPEPRAAQLRGLLEETILPRLRAHER